LENYNYMVKYSCKAVRAKRSVHITLILKNLHWRAVKENIIFKFLVVIYTAILYSYFITRLDVYFAQVVQLCCLVLPKTKTAFHGRRSFSAIETNKVLPIVLLHGLFKIRIKNV